MVASQLSSALAAAGLQSHQFANSHGGSFVVTPHGARVLGLFTADGGDNLFFVNPELATAATARAYLAGEHVLGGDRCWIAPERGLFFKGNTLGDGVTTQAAIDPGNWTVAQLTRTSIRLVNHFSATYFHAPGSTVRGIVERSIRMIPHPLVHAGALPDGVRYAGYDIASSFRLLESPRDDLYFGLWFLIQLVVPHGGYLYVPTAGKAVITGDYYEPTGPDYLKVTDAPHAHVRFKLDSIDRHKIGIRATEVLGRAAFLSNPFPGGGAEATLVIRNFLNNPSAHYADVPLHTPAGTQDSVQSYNHNTGPGGFGELEFHTPGINRAMPEPVVTDANQVWAFTGPRPALVGIAAKLLNLPAGTFDV
jgi:hypothetical protein